MLKKFSYCISFPCTENLAMLNCQSIQYVKKCMELGNELCPMNKQNVLIDVTMTMTMKWFY